jgi:hypothetical protein
MNTLPTPEEMAETLVVAGPASPGGSWYIQLIAPGDEPPVLLASHINPAVVRDEAGKVRRFIAAVIRQARESAPARDEPAIPA